MKTPKDLLKEFTAKISEGYNAERMDKRLIGFPHEHKKPVYSLWKHDKPITIHSISADGKLPEASKFVSRKVDPLRAAVVLNIHNFNFEEPVADMDSYMIELGNELAEREYHCIVKGISDYAGLVMKVNKKGTLSKSDIKNAQSWVTTNGRTYADTIIVPLEQMTEWMINNELWLPDKIPTGYVPEKDRGRFFAGVIGGVRVYWMRFTNDFALLYAKHKTILFNTLLEVYYDKPENPKELIAEKVCSSAPTLDQAVVKITL